jgi:hypothetical protein
VRDNLNGSPDVTRRLELSKIRGRAARSFCAAVRDGCDGVAEQLTRCVSQCQSGSSVRESTWIRRADAFPEMRSHPPFVFVWATAISKLSGGNHRA